MRIGMYLDMRNPPRWQRPWPAHYRRWLERIERAERLGAESVWLTEHHFFDDGYLPQCWTFAAAIAAQTSSVRIGTAVSLLPLHSALELAEQIALVDLISGGRAEPGFGVGYRKPEYLAFAADFKRRYHTFAERISEMRRLWGEQPGAEHPVTPAPIQRPMPMWAGFGGPRGARLAGRLGLGLLSLSRRLLDPYQQGLAEGGHDPATARMAGLVEFLLADDPDKASRQVEEHFAYRWQSYNRYMFEGIRTDANTPGQLDVEALKERFIVGSPEKVAQAITEQTKDLPVTDLYVWSDFPGLADDLIERHLELTFTRLAPLLRQA
jgi:alkanesulfonate monooxygenase SsuD/methylene tetrahydromethanopterin reductase-like flavin-dependent oxidoreductase (luciferase family)